MLVVDCDQGRVAFDIVDERLARDIDDEGLTLLALQRHEIRLAEVDSETINEDPRVGNSSLIWRHHGHRVNQQLVERLIACWPDGSKSKFGRWALWSDFLSLKQ